ncbi:hypothetical protein JTB14_001489 [Gonioctena quinquepunctata]|nr:hypothetical protein JTB14_001489 [Gonioctena quinquepunctata]
MFFTLICLAFFLFIACIHALISKKLFIGWRQSRKKPKRRENEILEDNKGKNSKKYVLEIDGGGPSQLAQGRSVNCTLHKYSESDDDLSLSEQKVQSSQPSTSRQIEQTPRAQSPQPSTSRQIEQTPRAQSPQPSTSRQIEQTPRAQSPQPSTSRQIEQTPRAQSPQRLTSRQSPVQTTPTKRVLSNISNIQTMKHVPIVLISPVPVPRGKKKKNPRPKQHSEILTSTPFKEVLDEKDRKKRIKMEKANAAKKI